ncbi:MULTISPECIES: DUF2905 domain-containing protein [Okeania]|uniref:DUF2905 domain-containing protein n=1 Tax=Okeania TaxID=1458928 RepID=UPI000F52C1B4|nr:MULTISPECIES: DUF2905 domain-containing protein [Okeania]NET76010.1 DUF2905 domain-containing protein [Okeania sp. SIO1F9]RQH21594.1 hypothetical protein D4Z78_09795 [Okeania hirsuta]
MTDVIKVLLNLQMPTMLIVAGLLIIILGFVTKIGGIIEVSREQKRFTIPIGLFLLVLGIVLNFASSPTPTPPTTTTTPTPTPPTTTTTTTPPTTTTTTGEKPPLDNSNIEPTVTYNEPTVTYNMNKIDSRSSYADIMIGNQNISGTFIVERLTLNWDYSKCPQFTNVPDLSADVMKESEYTASLTQKSDSKVLDDREFKYPPNDVDKFSIFINHSKNGVYTVWFDFDYYLFGNEDTKNKKTENKVISYCNKS